MLTLHLAANYEELASLTVERLARRDGLRTTLEKVMTPEWIVTPSLGARQYLDLQIARSQPNGAAVGGIAANIAHDFPSQIAGRVLAAHLTEEFGLARDPWALPQLQFSLYDWATRNSSPEIQDLLGDGDGRVLLSRCRSFADLIDRYITWRPEMIRRWVAGEVELAQEERQATVFNGLRAWIGVPTPAERWSDAWLSLPSHLDAFPASDRLTVFGLSTFPGGVHFVEALDHVARFIDVAVFMVESLDPSASEGLATKDAFETRILQSWGGLALTQSQLISALRERAERTTEPSRSKRPVTTTLQSLQYSLQNDTPPVRISPDASVIIHHAHGEARQADILRDALIHDLANSAWSPPLREEEILVVCPRPDKFAHLIRTSFGASRVGASAATTQLAYRISDRSLSQEGQYLQGIRHLLRVLRGRCTRSELLSFLSESTVLRAMRIPEDALEIYEEWTIAANIRWGLHATHREHMGLGALRDVNTWNAGLQRLSLGAFVDNPRLRDAGGILPVEVATGNFDNLVDLFRFYDAFDATLRSTWDMRTLPQWLDWFDEATHTLLEVALDDAREQERVLRAIKPLRDAGETSSEPFNFVEFVAILEEALGAIGSLGSLMTGGITITSPDSLRGIPYRSMYLIGFDDDAFIAPGFESSDLRRFEAHVGDVTPSDDARGRLREVLLNAKERLTVIRTEYDVTTNRKYEPGVAYSEFAETLATTVPESNDHVADLTDLDDGPVKQIVQVRHPRNSFSADNFNQEASAFDQLRESGFFAGSWSTADLDYAVAQARNAVQTTAANRGTDDVLTLASTRDITTSAPLDDTTLTLDDLQRCISNPPKIFTQRTLGIFLGSDEETRTDDVVAQADALLETIVLGMLWEEERSREAIVTASDIGAALQALKTSGDIPPEPLFNEAKITNQARLLAREYLAATTYPDGHPCKPQRLNTSVRVTVDTSAPSQDSEHLTPLPTKNQELQIVLDVEYFHIDGVDLVVEVVPKKLKLKHVVGAWLRTAALTTVSPSPVALHLIYVTGKEGDEAIASQRFDVAVSKREALQALEEAARFYVRNLQAPIPFALGEKTSNFADPKLTDKEWKYSQSYDATYLKDQYWDLALGHLDAEDVNRDQSEYGFKKVFPKMESLFNSVIPLFTFVHNFSNESASSKKTKTK